jgi:hypothetical protein
VAQPAESVHGSKPKSGSAWWVEPYLTVLALGFFGLYSLWLPALWVLWAPLLFRATCYYYRKEIYRGFFHDPMACGIPESRRKFYFGETRFPFIWTNLHRWFWYVALVVLVFLWIDAIQAFIFPTGFGVSLGSIIMLVNVILLTAYSLSCHAFRHLIGGGSQKFSCSDGTPTTRYKLWRTVSNWNERHGLFAWVSMFSVWFTDVYIRLLIYGVIHPVRFF